MAPLYVIPSPQARRSYIALSSIYRRWLSATSRSAGTAFDRSDFSSQPFTGSYEPGGPTRGPLGESASHGVPRLTPKKLKEYLDQYVVGQERSKKMMAVAIYNHYQRTREIMRQDEEQKEHFAKMLRNKYDRVAIHPVEEEYPGQVPTVDLNAPIAPEPVKRLGDIPTEQYNPTTIEKSNIMMIGPTGVGKTLLAKTLARILDVPFSISDCTPFTQSGYIGEDADVCVHRLLAASDFDVAACEQGIICLDEVDKLATARVSHGKDVSGEGVQQALLKIIEGTTLTITAKSDKASKAGSNPFGGGFGGGASASGALGGGNAQKTETYQVRTDNILFIFSGAFVGLEKIVLNRVSRSSMGFGAPVRARSSSESTSPQNPHGLDPNLFHKTLPFYEPPSESSNDELSGEDYNALDLVTPTDYQAYGLIPELTGRIPITTALSPLSLAHLLRILTEPRNALTLQYSSLFATYGAELRFTAAALHYIAEIAYKQGTGARGLRTIMERLLAQPMYEVPGSSVKYVLMTEAAARGDAKPGYWGRGQNGKFAAALAAEEERWEQALEKKSGEASEVATFEEYRVQATSGL